jgi:hypothetical protein
MKEGLFILFVIGILAALTAVKYRKQISGMIGFARMLKDAKSNLAAGSQRPPSKTDQSIPLVNCIKCGVWVPQNKANKIRDGYICSEH